MKAKHFDSLKQGKLMTWVSGLAILLSIPFILYIGYCWGLWGRHSLLLQYLFQCNCPGVSTEARYPKTVDVIVPACRYGSSTLSHSGRLLAIHEKNSENALPYLYDLQTSQKIPLSLPEKSGISFLTDNLLYITITYEDRYILDWTTGEQYPIKRFISLYPDAAANGYANLSLLAEALQKAKYVFLIEQDRTVVALASDFATSPNHNFLTGSFDLPGYDTDRVEKFLRSNNIAYQTILPYWPEEVISPNGKFIARPDGIYLARTGQKIVESYSASKYIRGYSGKYFIARGWTYDNKAVIYSDLLNPCLIETTFFIFDDYTCYFEVPQPLIKFKVPEEYLVTEAQ